MTEKVAVGSSKVAVLFEYCYPEKPLYINAFSHLGSSCSSSFNSVQIIFFHALVLLGAYIGFKEKNFPQNLKVLLQLLQETRKPLVYQRFLG